MKKAISVIIALMLLAVSMLPITASAASLPELMLAADYNDENKTITLQYRVLNFEGTESADFRLRFNPDAVEYVEHKEAKMSDVFMEIGVLPDKPDTIAIEFVDLYQAGEDDCAADGSATVVTFTFKVKDNATETVFISTTYSYNIAPDSKEISTDRATLKVKFTEGSKQFSTVEGYDMNAEIQSADQNNITKVIIGAVVAGAVFVGAVVVIAIKYRKK